MIIGLSIIAIVNTATLILSIRDLVRQTKSRKPQKVIDLCTQQTWQW